VGELREMPQWKRDSPLCLEVLIEDTSTIPPDRKAIRQLIEAGADVNCKCYVRWKDESLLRVIIGKVRHYRAFRGTPVHLLARKGILDMLDLAFKYGGDEWLIDLAQVQGISNWDYLLKNKKRKIHHFNNLSDSVHHEDQICWLIENGYTVNRPIREGGPTLLMTYVSYLKRDDTTFVDYMVKRGADANVNPGMGSFLVEGLIKQEGSLKYNVIKYLLEHGAVIDTTWHGQKSYLELAVNYRIGQECKDIMGLLVAHGAKLDDLRISPVLWQQAIEKDNDVALDFYDLARNGSPQIFKRRGLAFVIRLSLYTDHCTRELQLPFCDV
jgi:hypothetical protein